MTNNWSKFGERFARPTGAAELMEDLGLAVELKNDDGIVIELRVVPEKL